MRAASPPTASYFGIDLPTSFLREEKRLAGRALRAWQLSQRAAVPGFESASLTIAEPGGRAIILTIAAEVAAAFQLHTGQYLSDKPESASKFPDQTIAAELRAACDLVALRGRPIPFEASLAATNRGMLLVRGIALPLIGAAHAIDQAQIVISWREVLSRSASDRLRRELGEALRAVTSTPMISTDPFPVRRPSQALGAVMLQAEHRNMIS